MEYDHIQIHHSVATKRTHVSENITIDLWHPKK